MKYFVTQLSIDYGLAMKGETASRLRSLMEKDGVLPIKLGGATSGLPSTSGWACTPSSSASNSSKTVDSHIDPLDRVRTVQF